MGWDTRRWVREGGKTTLTKDKRSSYTMDWDTRRWVREGGKTILTNNPYNKDGVGGLK